jgi:hypothetical protein
MVRRTNKTGLCLAGWLLLTLVWPGLALAQLSSFVPAVSAAADISNLPDAPSASVPPAPEVVLQTQSRVSFAPNQSSWLVAPREAPYRPLSASEKFQSFVHHTFSPYTMAGAIYDAAWAQAWGEPKDYGGGMQGYGKRLGAAAAATEARSFFGSFLFPTLLHQDPRYFAMYRGPVVQRGLHAISRVFVTRADDGSSTFNSSGMMAIAFTESLGMAWMPERKRSAGAAFTCMLGAMQGDATSNLLREFTPDMLRIFKRHVPKSLKRFEQKITAQIADASVQQ